MNEAKLIHQWISDVFMITNESRGPQKNISAQDQQKTFLYEFSDGDKKFAFDDLDIILCNRLAKMRDENKFDYLFRCYERLEAHIVAKRKHMADMIKEMKDITARYFVTCLTCPDTFDLNNDIKEISDKVVPMGFGGGADMEAMMEAAMMGGMMPGMGNPESLGSGRSFEFT
jgi:hypothetical protein